MIPYCIADQLHYLIPLFSSGKCKHTTTATSLRSSLWLRHSADWYL